MKVIKVFETSFDICDVEKLYQPISTILMEELKAKYEKRCYKSSYIIEIKDIIHYSECEISTDHQQCIGLLNVMFTALVEIYTPGNIIPVCKLEIKRSNGEFIAESDDAKIQLIPNTDSGQDRILPAFKVGDRFPIQVRDVTYGAHQQKMTVVGCLPDIKPEKLTIYKINPANHKDLFTNSQLKAIGDFIEKNDKTKWISSLSTVDKKKFDDYVALTYPYKENKTSSLPKTTQFNFTSVEELKKINAEYSKKPQPFYICYPPEVTRSRPIAYLVTGSSLEQYKNLIFEENPMVVITDWITIHHNYMEFVKSLTENYPSPTSDRYKALWGLIHLRKEN
jgi:hypothetical protein